MRAARVLVCGGRDFADKTLVAATLDAVFFSIKAADPKNWRSRHMVLIHGAARGADSLAAEWARTRKDSAYPIDILPFPADWATLGRSAGPIRNQRMLDEGKPDLVVAFPGGRGTADMVRRAEAAGVKVQRVE